MDLPGLEKSFTAPPFNALGRIGDHDMVPGHPVQHDEVAQAMLVEHVGYGRVLNRVQEVFPYSADPRGPEADLFRGHG